MARTLVACWLMMLVACTGAKAEQSSPSAQAENGSPSSSSAATEGSAGAGGPAGPQGPAGPGGPPGTTGPMGPPGSSAASNGSRLKVRWQGGVDGSRAFAAWYDSQLGVDCYFTTAEDGRTRCIPVSTAFLGNAYVDPNCTQRVMVALCGATPPKYVYDIPQGTCTEARYVVYAMGSRVGGSQHYTKAGNSCVGITLSAGETMYAVAPVSASSFVEGTTTLD